MNAQELHQILLRKWGFSFDLQLRRIRDKVYLQVMWKYLEQASFPLSEAEYFAHLETLTTYLNEWGVGDQVKTFIHKTKERPRLGKAVSIPLNLGDRLSEWIIN
jgi:hypothetical protein